MRSRIDLGSSGSIDLYDNIPISLNYSIADIRSPEKRNASFSKTITIPGSKANDKIFGHIFEIGINGSFNPNIKTPATIYTDECEQLKGFLQLLKIKRDDENKIEYEVSIIGNVGNIFTELGDSLLNEIDLSEYNHTYNKTNQKASWTATIGQGYVYPMINYGATNGLTYDVNNFFPAIYLKQYIDKIFNSVGYTYSSNFFNSDFFKRLVIPYNGNRLGLTQSQLDVRQFSATIGSSGSITLPSTVGQTYEFTTLVPYNSETLDPSNQFNTSTNRFVAANAGDYSFFASFNYQLNSSFGFPPSGYAFIIKYSGGLFTVINSVNLGTQFGEINTTQKTAYISAGVTLAVGDEVFVGLRFVTVTNNTPKVNLSGGYFYNNAYGIVIDGNELILSTAIPEKIKKKDLFFSVIKMFNLYMETDKDVTNKLYIEPRNDFYSSGVTKMWTDKLDVSQPLEISPMGDLTSRRYNFTYTDDKDYYNDLYKRSYSEAYGTRLIDTNNEFITGTNETKVIFSPTPLVDQNSNDRILSYIADTYAGVTTNPKAFNIRLLYYGGVKNTVYPWTYTSLATGNTTESTYSYAGHLDDTNTPTLDLNFGVPKEVYYFAISYSNNNIYNKYHRQFLEEITDPDSKTVKGYFYLTPIDIMELDFRNQFYVDGHFLRLNKISDYDPTKNGLCQCEFIKIKNTNTFVPQSIGDVGGIGIGIGFDD